MEFVTTLISFILAIGILVAVHEFGHFWVARRVGVRVLRFSIGFGRPLWRREAKDGTEYVLAAIPLGGYVKMLDEREGEVAPEERPYSFNSQSKTGRALIVAAGPALNFLFAILAYWLVFSLGEQAMRPLVGQVEVASVAAKAGIQAGDELLRIGDTRVQSWEQGLFALLEAALDKQDLPVQVRGANGNERSLWLPGEAMASLMQDEGDIFAKLGLAPRRLPAVIGEVIKGEAAEQAGLKSGDRVLKANGQQLQSWPQWVELIRANPGRLMSLEVERAGALLDLEVRVGQQEQNGVLIGRVGAGVDVPQGWVEQMQTQVRYEPLAALGMALQKTADVSMLSLRVLWKMLTGEASVRNLGGPISIAQSAGQSASHGLVSFLKFLALVSVSLGVLNLLPVPVLDGGHLVYILIEAVKGSPLSDKALEQTQKVGMVLLLSLMLLAFYVDIIRLVNQ
jgi:regulator of sigma E protease